MFIMLWASRNLSFCHECQVVGHVAHQTTETKRCNFFKQRTLLHRVKELTVYSHLFNKHGGWNKRGGGTKVVKSLNVEAGINVEGGIFWKN